jgi:hypothetical protein
LLRFPLSLRGERAIEFIMLILLDNLLNSEVFPSRCPIPTFADFPE